MTTISRPAPATPIVNGAACSLPALIDRARTRLAEARTSAEVLEARAAAQAALHYAKLQKAANETQADCLLLIKRAEIRLADEIDAAQRRGEVARHGGDRRSRTNVQSPDLDPATFDELGLPRQRVDEWRELRDAGENVVEAAVQSALDEGRAPTHAGIQRTVKGDHHRTRFTGETEWYTPAECIEAARRCLGSIDLDPATAPAAQETVRAARFFTRDDDGLRQEWHGRIWLNPPYTQPEIVRFVDKLIAEFAAGRATEAILLTHNYTDTGWFHAAAGQCAAICFTRGRIRSSALPARSPHRRRAKRSSTSALALSGSAPASAASGSSDERGQRIQPAALGLRAAGLLQPEAPAEDRDLR